MSNLKVLTISFDTPIKPWELRQFRGALSESVGYDKSHFHNHDNQNGGFHYRYPLIQYKYHNHKPMLVCLNDGVEEMQHFFTKSDWTLNMKGREVDMKIDQLNMRQYRVDILENSFRYHIRNWIPFNSENYKIWQNLESITEQSAFLETLMANHIVSFCYGVNSKPENRIEVKITELETPKSVSFKRLKMLCFSAVFRTNLSLPDFVGLGKGVSMGFGTVRRLGEKRSENQLNS